MKRLPIETLETSEIKQIISHVDKRTLIGKRDYAVLYVLLMGLRKGEVMQLCLDDIKEFNGMKSLFVQCLKKRKIRGRDGFKEKVVKREIPLKAEAYDAIEKYIVAEHGEIPTDKNIPLFMTQPVYGPWKKKSITRVSINHIVEKYTKLAGIKKHVSPHSFRHTFATQLVQQNVDLATIKSLLGHEHIGSTEKYLHSNTQQRRDAVECLQY